MPKVRDAAIDALKGFLIILVILAHNGGTHPFVMEFGHPVRMGMFFMVSGYLIHGKLKLKKRLRGTLFPFLFFVGFSIVWLWMYGFISHEPLHFCRWSKELIAGSDWGLNIPMWFLISYAQLLVLVWLLDKIKNQSVRWGCVVILMMTGLEMMRNGINTLYMGRTLEYLPFFIIGGELQPLFHRFHEGKYPFVTILLIGFLIWIRVSVPPMDYYIRWFVDSMLALAFVCLFYNLFRCSYFPTGVFAYYGRNSIVVLCMHILILDVVWRLWYRQFGQPDMTAALIMTLIIAVSLYPCCEIYGKYIGPKLK